jgi:hypothetical protein
VKTLLAAEPGIADGFVDASPELVLAPLVRETLDADAAAGLDLILEGFLLHHGRPRHLSLDDPGRRVLAGDYCYASGLTRVAAAGDLRVIELLAELVALSSALVATGKRDALPALWRATAHAIADPDPENDAALRCATTVLRIRSDSGPIVALAATSTPAPDLEDALRA